MKRYEYKFIYLSIKSSIGSKERRRKEQEVLLNELGADGWKYCTTGDDCLLFIRELSND